MLLLLALVVATLVAGTDVKADVEVGTEEVAEDEDAAAEAKMLSCAPGPSPCHSCSQD